MQGRFVPYQDLEHSTSTVGVANVHLVGTIYNLNDLAREKGMTPRGESARVLEALLVNFPPETLLPRLRGTFAFAWHDRQRGRLVLVRDRFGSVPLLYRSTESGIYWGNTVVSVAGSQFNVDRQGLSESVHYGWLVGESTLISGVRQIPPASYVVISRECTSKPETYWLYKSVPRESVGWEAFKQQTKAALHDALATASKSFSRPAILLSGGVDSSLLAALAREHFENLCAVTVEVEGWTNPEVPRAIAVAKQLGIPIQVASLKPDRVVPLFSRMNILLEEPSRHFSSISLLHAVDAVPESCDSVVYGEAADTLFGSWAVVGYAQWVQRHMLSQHLPGWLRALAAKLAEGSRRKRITHIRELVTRTPEQMLNSVSKIDYSVSPDSVFCIDSEPTPDPATVQLYSSNDSSPYYLAQERLLATTVVNHLVYLDRFLRPRGLGMICPFLDEPMLNVARSLPKAMAVENGVIKPVLKELASTYCDRELMYAKKYGFEAPAASWTKQIRSATPRLMVTNPVLQRHVREQADSIVANSNCHSLQWTWLCLQAVFGDVFNTS